MEEVRAILPQFTGAIAQVPPAFSALKVDGKRAYDLARAGESVDLESRQVTIRDLSIRRPCEGATVGEVTLTAQVSKGTYIRSLARDIAHALGTVGHVSMLRRTKAGPFRLDQAISLDILMEKAKARALEDVTLPIRTALDDIPALALTPEQARLLHNGQVLTGIAAQGGLHLALNGETPLALVEGLDGNVRTVRRFNL